MTLSRLGSFVGRQLPRRGYLASRRPSAAASVLGCLDIIRTTPAVSPCNDGRHSRGLTTSKSGGGGKDGPQKQPQGKNQQDNRNRLQPGGGTTNSNSNSNSSKPPNFDERVLRPASRGVLRKKHDSGIPKLAARKHKARLDPRHDRGRPRFLVHRDRDVDDDDDEEGGAAGPWDELDDLLSPAAAGGGEIKPKGSPQSSLFDFDGDELAVNDYYDTDLLNDDKYYWREEEYEDLLAFGGGAGSFDEEDFRNEDGEIELEYMENEVTEGKYYNAGAAASAVDLDVDDDMDYDDMEGDNDARRGGYRSERWESADPEMHFFYDQNSIINVASLGPEHFKAGPGRRNRDGTDGLENIVLPLRDHGPDADDFVEAMIEHPSRIAHVSRRYRHPGSRREPKPLLARNRSNPPPDFVESHSRFLYVTGLPPLDVNGEPGDIGNAIHRGLLEKSVAKLVGVDSEQVRAANGSSAFVGFPSPAALAAAIRRGPTDAFASLTPAVALYDQSQSGDDDNKLKGLSDFVKGSPDSVLEIVNIPSGNTPESLIRQLFPEGSEVKTVYGNISLQDIFFKSSTNALVRFSSKEQALSAVDSMILGEQLKALGQYRVRYFRARRELVHAGFGGPAKSEEVRAMGPRLIVDGEMPSSKFYRGHVAVLQLKNLDPTLGKEEVSDAFQPYCTRRRDVHGSIEFVTCEAGLPTGCAYVGFDSVGEAESIIRSLSGTMMLGDRRATLRLVKDRVVPGTKRIPVECRLERSAEELLNELDNWQQYVAREDLELLERAGISHAVLDEALRSIRYKNATFGPLDSGLRSESIEPEKLPGDQYKELVQMYISTLKECLPSHENVGEIYEAMHFPNEAIDLSVFDREKGRQQKLLERRVNP